MLAIVAPLAIELAAIRRSIPNAAERNISLGIMGVGKKPAQHCVSALAESRPEAIILFGFCGGADPGLKPGHLHIARSFLNPDLPDAVESDPRLNALLVRAGEHTGAAVTTGPSATVKDIAGTVAKSQLHAATGSASVNMEDYWAARAARHAGIPFASVRAVLDSAHTEIPGYLSSPPSSDGQILRGLILHPGRLPAMVRLAWAARAARASLTRSALSAVDSLSSPRPVLSAVPK